MRFRFALVCLALVAASGTVSAQSDLLGKLTDQAGSSKLKVKACDYVLKNATSLI